MSHEELQWHGVGEGGTGFTTGGCDGDGGKDGGEDGG